MTRRALLSLALVALVPAGAQAAADPAKYMPAELVAQSVDPAPGSTTLVGFRFSPRPGWHGYWSNPGDAGFAPSVQWSGPEGVTFGPLMHPPPTRISADGIVSFVHDGPHSLLSRMTIAGTVPNGTRLPVKARLNWAACTATQCVPLNATFNLDLVAGDGGAAPGAAGLQVARRKLPGSVNGGSFWADSKIVTLRIPDGIRLDRQRAAFFPDKPGFVGNAPARSDPETASALLLQRSGDDLPERLSGIVSDGRDAYRVRLAHQSPALSEASTLDRSASEPVAPVGAEQEAGKQPPAPVTLEAANKAGSAPKERRWLLAMASALIALAGIGAALRWDRRGSRK